MKCEPWEQYEEDFLREVASSMTVEGISEKLERTTAAVTNKASRIGVKLSAKRVFKSWNKDEEAMISTLPAITVANLTGRSIYAIRAKRYKLSRREAA